jgi:hypothetical protein
MQIPMRRQIRRQRPMAFFPWQSNTPANHLLQRHLIRRILMKG